MHNEFHSDIIILLHYLLAHDVWEVEEEEWEGGLGMVVYLAPSLLLVRATKVDIDNCD